MNFFIIQAYLLETCGEVGRFFGGLLGLVSRQPLPSELFNA